MELRRRSTLIYGLLLAAWAVVVVWQIQEHLRVREAARTELVKRSKDITSTLGVVLRAQLRFNRWISKDRLEFYLNELVKQGDLKAVEVLNQAGDSVAAAGTSIDPESKGLLTAGEHWGNQTVTLMANVIDLGTNLTSELGGTNPPVILSEEEFNAGRGTNRVPGGTNRMDLPPSGPRGPSRGPPDEAAGPPPQRPDREELSTNSSSAPTNAVASSPRPPNRGRRGGPPRFGRPPWMSEDQFQAVIQNKGAHSFLLVMSTESMNVDCNRDLWLRAIISALAALSVVGLGLAWRNLGRSSELEVRLARASELNARLKEMNLAAAGLAHETRNPLNIIRGLAQMISRQPDASPEIRGKTREMIDETDRVTAQLNEFINYSRPREVRRSALALGSVVGEVVRALNYDIEEKVIHLEVQSDLPRIEGDEQLLRQALFNLLLNAVQAVERGGEIQVACHKGPANDVVLDIKDNGPGVPPEQRTDIFKPYFTTHQNGTGLGLAVVQQIIKAHGWEIQCLSNEPRGAVFRITHLRLAGNGRSATMP